MAVTTVIKLTHPEAQDVKVWPENQPREQAAELAKVLETVAAGKPPGCSLDVTFAGTVATKAAAVITIADTVTGALTVTINGVEIAVTAGADEAATVTAILEAIGAETDSLVADMVVASEYTAASVAITAKQRGVMGNAITLAVSGTGLAIADSNTRLVGGAGDDERLYTYSYV